ncbi:MAG: transglycosylase SLT domain-containing protein [Anaerolineales bacterium]|nr:transglycosylase SLT domain-containing protein [Anaerolineales bacterium]
MQNDAAAPSEIRREATYDLARAYLADGLYGEAVATLDNLDQALAVDGVDPNQFGLKEQFLRGEAHMGQGQYDAAIAAYWRFLEAYPWMNEAVQPQIAGAYLALNDPGSAAVALRRAADAATSNSSKASLLEQLAQALVDAGDYAGAVAAYDEILAFAQNTTYRALQQYQAGQALAAAGDGPGAIARWQAATAEEPSATSAYLALVELVNRSVDFDLYQRGVIDVYAEAYEPAANAFTAYLAAVDSSDSRYGNALHGLGLAYLGSGAYANAIAAFDRVIAEQPQCDCFGQAWIDKAEAQLASGDGAAARRTYRTFARDYAGDPLAPEARWQSGLSALGDGNQVEAAVDFLALADAFPQSERTPPALYALGIGAFSKSLFGQSVQVLDRLQRGYPDYRPEAVSYWHGRALAADNNLDAARAQWQALVARAPDVYYGVLAAYGLADMPMTNAAMLERIDAVAGAAGRLAGDDGSQAFAEQWLSTWITGTQGNMSELPPALAEDPDLLQGRLLLDLDRRGDALGPLESFYDRNRDNPAALYPMSLEFARLGAYRLSLLAAARLLVLSEVPLVEDGPIFIQRLAYPRPFNDLIVREAQAAELNPSLYFSLIRQESLFEEGAQSSAAAQGLAQIIPDTGRWIAEQVGHPEYTNAIIYRPVINVRFGAYYLDWARDLLDGNLISALAGYNAGPGNADAWRENAGADDTLFVEQLTFSEPRIYIQQVLSNLYHYTRLYR